MPLGSSSPPSDRQNLTRRYQLEENLGEIKISLNKFVSWASVLGTSCHSTADMRLEPQTLYTPTRWVCYAIHLCPIKFTFIGKLSHFSYNKQYQWQGICHPVMLRIIQKFFFLKFNYTSTICLHILICWQHRVCGIMMLPLEHWLESITFKFCNLTSLYSTPSIYDTKVNVTARK